jgi:hypothetical protein
VDEIVIFRLSDGRIVEAWGVFDEAGTWRQLGVSPARLNPWSGLSGAPGRSGLASRGCHGGDTAGGATVNDAELATSYRRPMVGQRGTKEEIE